MLNAKAASWQNRLLMYWPSESVGTITELSLPRLARTILHPGRKPVLHLSSWAWWASGHRRKIPQHAKKKIHQKDSKKENVLETRPTPVCGLFCIFHSLRTSAGMLKSSLSPTAHAITSTQTCSRCSWVCAGARGHSLSAALTEERMRGNATNQEHLLKHVWSSLALD